MIFLAQAKAAEKKPAKKVVKTGLTLEGVVFELVKVGVRTPEELAKKVGQPVEVIQKILDGLEKKGLIIKK